MRVENEFISKQAFILKGGEGLTLAYFVYYRFEKQNRSFNVDLAIYFHNENAGIKLERGVRLLRKASYHVKFF